MGRAVALAALLFGACEGAGTGAAPELEPAETAADPEPEVVEPSSEPAAVPAPDAGADATEVPSAPPGTYAYLVVEPIALAFGERTVGDVTTLAIDLENAGTATLNVGHIGFSGTLAAFAANATAVVLEPGGTRELLVTFYAQEEGSFEDALRFESNSVQADLLEVPVSGAAVPSICKDVDGDGHGLHCPLGSDCNESDPEVFSGAPERCNGKDDDCDGLHDEDHVGLGTACTTGFGACTVEGTRVCAADEASLLCAVNAVTGGSELCNDQDDDCDGATDEDFPSKGKLCSVGKGACTVYDKFVCSKDETALVCNVTPKPAGVEVCKNGQDDDCDGKLDEGTIEVCDDAVDNDCDGQTDESGSVWGEVFFARDLAQETVLVYPSKGDGSFADPIPLAFPNSHRHQVHAVGDFNGDAWLDLVVFESKLVASSKLCETSVDCPTGFVCQGICRKLCSNANQCDKTLLEECVDHGNTSGATDTYCTPPLDLQLAVAGCGATTLFLQKLLTLLPGERLGPVIDADGNGHLDFVVLGHWSNPKGHVWLNDGKGLGALSLVKKLNAFEFGPLLSWSWGLAFTSKDVDGDGRVDMIGMRFDSDGSPPSRLFLFRGNGDGTFAVPVELTSQVPFPSNLVTANDFDGDGDHDVVAGLDDDGQPGNVWILLNRNDPSGNVWVNPYAVFDVVPAYQSGADHPGVGDGTSFDFDGDRQPDVLAAWTPEECGSYVWGCKYVNDPADLCFDGRCRKLAFIRNDTRNPCVPGTSCVDGQCVGGCEPDCLGKQCGPDGCGGSCGLCAGGQLCAGGSCVVDCVPECEGKSCGDNGCGGTCGDCPQGESCLQGSCKAGCVPSCAGKVCGDDGCGGRCAVFDPPQVFEFSDNPATTLRAPTNVPPTKPKVAIAPKAPLTVDDLACTVTAPSYDIDPVTYTYRWFRNGEFASQVGDTPNVPASLTAPGEIWTCRVRATDGIEHSPWVEAQTGISFGDGP